MVPASSSDARADDPPPSPTVPEAAPPVTQPLVGGGHTPRKFASEPDVEEPAPKRVAVEWLPLRLLVPVGAFAAEVRVTARTSATVSFGYGSAPVTTAAGAAERRPAWQLGLSAQGYVGGDFEDGGIHLGVSVLYTRVGDDAVTLRTGALQPGFLLGPLLGFKYVIARGFTLDSQIGIGVRVGKGGAAPADEDQKTALLGDLAVGWAF